MIIKYFVNIQDSQLSSKSNRLTENRLIERFLSVDKLYIIALCFFVFVDKQF